MQIELTVPEYLDARQAERDRTLAQLLAQLAKSHDADWYRWILARQRGEHAHDLRRADGTPAACPVRGCTELAGAESDQQRVA